MPRYEDRDRSDRGYRGDDRGYRSERSERFEYRGDDGATRLYVGGLSTRTRSRDLEDVFAKYGRYESLPLSPPVGWIILPRNKKLQQAQFSRCFLHHAVAWAAMCTYLHPTCSTWCVLSARTLRHSCVISLDLYCECRKPVDLLPFTWNRFNAFAFQVDLHKQFQQVVISHLKWKLSTLGVLERKFSARN